MQRADDAGVDLFKDSFCLFDTPDRLQHMFWRFGSRITLQTGWIF
jgi:hypothetical protein